MGQIADDFEAAGIKLTSFTQEVSAWAAAGHDTPEVPAAYQCTVAYKVPGTPYSGTVTFTRLADEKAPETLEKVLQLILQLVNPQHT